MISTDSGRNISTCTLPRISSLAQVYRHRLGPDSARGPTGGEAAPGPTQGGQEQRLLHDVQLAVQHTYHRGAHLCGTSVRQRGWDLCGKLGETSLS